MKELKKFHEFVNEAKNAVSTVQLNKQGKEEIKKLEQAMSSLQDALNDANWKGLYKYADKVKFHANNLKNFNYVNESNESEPVNEAIVSGITVYEIASPAPVGELMNEVEDKMGKRFPYIRSEVFTSPDGLESILAFNLSNYDIKKLKEIGDILIYKMDLTNRKEI